MEVQQVDVQGANSAMGILPTHVPTLAVLKPGKLTVKEESGDIKTFFGASNTQCSVVSIINSLSYEIRMYCSNKNSLIHLGSSIMNKDWVDVAQFTNIPEYFSRKF